MLFALIQVAKPRKKAKDVESSSGISESEEEDEEDDDNEENNKKKDKTAVSKEEEKKEDTTKGKQFYHWFLTFVKYNIICWER